MEAISYCGYYPGVTGEITAAHADYYHRHWGLDVSFEAQVGGELSEFAAAYREGRDGLWVARAAGTFAGSIVIDARHAETKGARLRWFIVVDEFQGMGIGKTLLEKAVGFCRAMRYPVYLWTFSGLDRARSLYEKEGFHLAREHTVEQWGRRITEQMFELVTGEQAG